MKDKPQSSREHNQAKKKAAEFYWAKKKILLSLSFCFEFRSAAQHPTSSSHHQKKNEIHSSSRSIHERVYFLVFIVFRRQFFSPSSFVYRQTAAAGAEVKPRKFPKDSFSTVQLLFVVVFFFFGSKIDFPHIIKNERSVQGVWESVLWKIFEPSAAAVFHHFHNMFYYSVFNSISFCYFS